MVALPSEYVPVTDESQPSLLISNTEPKLQPQPDNRLMQLRRLQSFVKSLG